MNIFNFVFGACNNIRRESISNFSKKDSKILSGINRNEKRKEEILSTDTTNNLEIIDYPYSNNITEEISFQIDSFDYYKINDKNEIQNIISDLDDCNILNNNDYNRKNSLNNSSEIINNEDNLSKNKALLNNYYSNSQNLKNKNINLNNVNNTNDNINNVNQIKNIGDNYIKESNEIDTKYNHINKLGVKIDMPSPDSNSFISKKINNKSKSQGEIEKEEKNIKIKIKIDLKKNQKLEKSNTNYILFKKNNKDVRKNIILKKKRDTNSNNKDKKNRVYNTKRIYTPINNCRNIPKKHIIKNKLQKKSIQGKNTVVSNNHFYKINKNYNSFRYNNYIILNNNKSANKNLVSSYIENEQNNLDFSYLWINNRGSNNSTKTILNPFEKIEIKKKKINKIRFSNKNNHLK